MAAVTAFLDANVLYPAPLRDLLMRLALSGLCRAKWSYWVHEEWIGAVLKNRPDLVREQLERTRALMDRHAEDCLVQNFEPLIDALDLPDPDDRHVLAAAICGRADVIVTRNVSDFPADRLAPFGIEAQHPDAFVSHLLDIDAEAVVAAARQHRASLKRPPMTVDVYLQTLERQGLASTVAALREHADAL